MTYTANDIRHALINEHTYLAHEDYTLQSVDSFKHEVNNMSYDELVETTGVDDTYTLETFMMAWG